MRAVSDSTLLLVVDDDLDVREVLCMVLEDAGYRTVEAKNGLEALDTLRTMPEKPRAILLDLKMPVLSGREFLALRQTDPALAAVPVVLMSGAGDGMDLDPAAHVLMKPASMGEVLRVVARAVADASST
jgi:CheY-like chemotaxis protein